MSVRPSRGPAGQFSSTSANTAGARASDTSRRSASPARPPRHGPRGVPRRAPAPPPSANDLPPPERATRGCAPAARTAVRAESPAFPAETSSDPSVHQSPSIGSTSGGAPASASHGSGARSSVSSTAAARSSPSVSGSAPALELISTAAPVRSRRSTSTPRGAPASHRGAPRRPGPRAGRARAPVPSRAPVTGIDHRPRSGHLVERPAHEHAFLSRGEEIPPARQVVDGRPEPAHRRRRPLDRHLALDGHAVAVRLDVVAGRPWARRVEPRRVEPERREHPRPELIFVPLAPTRDDLTEKPEGQVRVVPGLTGRRTRSASSSPAMSSSRVGASRVSHTSPGGSRCSPVRCDSALATVGPVGASGMCARSGSSSASVPDRGAEGCRPR